VEDSENDALLLLRELERGGYQPEYERVDTPEAMKKALDGGSASWDVIFSDYHMPRFRAPEALELAHEAGSEAPFIVVSGRIGEEVAVELMKAGAYDYVMKDNLARLCATVERGLEEFRERRERKRAEKELRESEERYRAVIEQATDGIYLLDADTRRLVETNPSFQTLLGYTAIELEGMEVYDFVAHERADVESTIRRTLELRRRLVGERKYRRKDATLVDVEVGVSVISYGGREMICTIVRDVSSRKQAEEELREAEERFRSAFGDAAIGMALVGTDGRWLQVNRSLCQLVGYPEEELLTKTFQDITHPDDLEADQTYVRRLLTGEIQTYQMEKRYLHRDGHVVWISLNVSLMRDAEGFPLYFISQMQDITERKQAEEALARSENRLRTIIETEPECVKVLGMDGSLLEMNPAGLSMIEADSLEQVRGKPVYEYIATEHRTDFVALTERVLHGGSGTLEFEIVGLKGTSRWLDTHAVPLRGARGEIAGLLAITRDITERKKNEEALRQSERLYRAVIEQATENIFLVDVKTRRIVESNPAFRETLGYTEEELRRMRLYDVIAADRESIDANVERVLELKNPFVGQRQYRRKDGPLVDVEVSASTILHNGRETLCVVAHDVTERARAQQLLEERLALLSGIAANLTLELPVRESLNILAKSVLNASTAVACSVALIDESTGFLRIEGSHGLPEGFKRGIETVWRDGSVHSPTMEAIRARRPTLAGHRRQRMLEDPLYTPVHRWAREAMWDTVFIVPLVSKGRTLGVIHFSYLQGEQPGEDERVFLRAVADQAAVAVENARLFSEARGKAALEERQRLARELHDSVSQALYGIALGAKTARTLLDQEPDRATDPLDYVLSLAEAGMAEMRALIFELRPESLETEGLTVALEKQAAALRARHEIEVEASLCDEPKASPGAKETVYRIAQEALHNIVKHAYANRVEIKMECDPEWITLDVSDDGVGFDARKEFPGHLGLDSMRERASRLGGTLRVQTAPGRGTRIWVRIPF
jgi:PAS domain S-box-containing protein